MQIRCINSSKFNEVPRTAIITSLELVTAVVVTLDLDKFSVSYGMVPVVSTPAPDQITS